MPHEITSIHYEDLRKNTAPNVECILRHFDLHVPSATVRRAIASAPDYALNGKTDPDEPERIIGQREIAVDAYFAGEDGEHFREIISKNLRHTFGYNYAAAISKRPKSTARNRVASNPIA